MEKKITKDEQAQRDFEINQILQMADEVPTTKLFIGEEGDLETLDEMKSIIAGDTDDPETKYDLYYKGIQKVLRSELPRGTKYKQLRDEIREELAVFLTEGKRKINGVRGADSRMGRLPLMEKVFDIVFNWRGDNGTPAELYLEFRRLNEGNDNDLENY